jgi:N-acetylglucosamine-6-phosphate deacetylase
VELTLSGGTIRTVEEIPADEELPWLMPVLVDVQQNGALGRYYNELHEAPPEHLQNVAALLRRHGVGRCLMTLTTYPADDLLSTARRLRTWLEDDPELDALFPGVFHEGIFVSPEDGWRGAHNRDWVRPPDYDHIRRIDDALGGRVRMVNVAPERPGGLEFVSAAARDDKLVAIGHSGPDAETIRESVARGASVVTHFGNGAPSYIHRHRNPFWTFLVEEQLRLGLIGDGFHLPPDLVRTALKAKGPDGCFMVSDASGYSGCEPGEYSCMGGRDFVIESNGHMHLAGDEILSGAWFQIDRSVEFLVSQLGLSLPAAWNLCSRTPAALAGIDLPEPAEGEEASFVLARWDEGLVLDQCVHRGSPCLSEPWHPTDL